MSNLIYGNLLVIFLIVMLVRFLKNKRTKETEKEETVKKELPAFEIEKKYIDEKTIDNYKSGIIISVIYLFLYIGIFGSFVFETIEGTKELSNTSSTYIIYFVLGVIIYSFIRNILLIIKYINLKNKITNYEYTFVLDTVLDKKIPFYDTNKHYLIFDKVGKVKVTEEQYNGTNLNDTFYILKVGKDKQLFNTNKYELREEDKIRLEH